MTLGYSSFDVKSTVLVLALVLVPIVVLFCILAIALACSEFWSSRPGLSRLAFWRRARSQHKRSRSDPPRSSTSTKRTDSTEDDLDYQNPVRLLLSTVPFSTKSAKTGMEDFPRPLRIVKSPPANNTRSNHSESYPEIPVRRSSFRESSRMFSGVPPSPPTPSPMGSNMDRLDVRKTRKAGARPSEAAMSSPSYSYDSPAPNTMSTSQASSYLHGSTDEDHHEGKGGIVKRVLRAFDSRSRKASTENPFPISYPFPEGSFASTSKKPSAEIPHVPGYPVMQHPNFGLEQRILTPQSAPTINAEIQAVTGDYKVSTEEILLWSNVSVTLGLEKREIMGPRRPLNVVIILDNTSAMSIHTLREICDIGYTVVTTLDRQIDHLAVGCVDDSAQGSLKLLLPLGAHTKQEAKREMDMLHSRYIIPTNQEPTNEEGLKLHRAVRQASHILISGGNALCHIFFITSDPPVPFPMPNIDKRVGFHTISPEARFLFSGPEVPLGWHMSTNIHSSPASLTEKIRDVMAHLHTGINPGTISHLKLMLTAGEGCQIESFVEGIRLHTLRLGEKWTVPVQVRVPAASVKQMLRRSIPVEKMAVGHGQENQTIADLISQLQEILDVPGESEPQTILTAWLEYKHSFLPESSSVCQVAHCNIVRALPKDSAGDSDTPNPIGTPQWTPPQWAPAQAPMRRQEPSGGAPGPSPRIDRPTMPFSATPGYRNPSEWAEEHLPRFPGYRYHQTPSASSFQNLRNAAAGPSGAPRETLADNTNLLREFPFNQRRPSPMAPSSRPQPPTSSFRDRMTRSHENIRSKFKLFGDRQKVRGGLQDHFVLEEPKDEEWDLSH